MRRNRLLVPRAYKQSNSRHRPTAASRRSPPPNRMSVKGRTLCVDALPLTGCGRRPMFRRGAVETPSRQGRVNIDHRHVMTCLLITLIQHYRPDSNATGWQTQATPMKTGHTAPASRKAHLRLSYGGTRGKLRHVSTEPIFPRKKSSIEASRDAAHVDTARPRQQHHKGHQPPGHPPDPALHELAYERHLHDQTMRLGVVSKNTTQPTTPPSREIGPAGSRGH